MFLPHPRVKVSIVGSLRDREVARARISNPVSGGQCRLNHLTILKRFLLAQFSLYVHKGGLKPDSFFHLKPYIYGSGNTRVKALK